MIDPIVARFVLYNIMIFYAVRSYELYFPEKYNGTYMYIHIDDEIIFEVEDSILNL